MTYFNHFQKGASAGAGSGEFDIYRGCRRRELIRQEYLQKEDDKVKEHQISLYKLFLRVNFTKKKAKEEFDDIYQKNLTEAEKKTAKKREKR